jgi:hypothetical protein
MKCKSPKEHYGNLEQTLFSEDELVRPEGLVFNMHDEMIGKTDHGERKFLVFYFDDADDYKVVLDKLSIKKSKVRSHPDMDSKQLAKILREGEVKNDERK